MEDIIFAVNAVLPIILMIVVLFFRKGIMGTKEFNWNFILKRLDKKNGGDGK